MTASSWPVLAPSSSITRLKAFSLDRTGPTIGIHLPSPLLNGDVPMKAVEMMLAAQNMLSLAIALAALRVALLALKQR